jgi:23S rRNA pseudoU1915 N3-methylase RlmH
MKLKFYIFETKSPSWVAAAREEYTTKLRAFADFEVQTLKSPTADREEASVKLRKEAALLLKHLDPKDLLVLSSLGASLNRARPDWCFALAVPMDLAKKLRLVRRRAGRSLG